MSAVSNLIESKGSDVLTVEPGQTVQEAMVAMGKISAGTAVVMDGDKVVGIMSERDLIRKVVLEGKSVESVKVEEIMTTDLTTVAAQPSLDDCMKLMTDKRVRHLPVMCGDSLCGIVSIGDVVKYLVVEKDFKIKNLESYISGSM